MSCGTSERNSSKISFNSSPERFKSNRINPILMSGSEIKQSTPFGPQLAAKIFPPENSLVTMSKVPSSRFLPCSSLAQKTADAIAPIPSTSAGKYENFETLAIVKPVRSTRITFLIPDSLFIIFERILSKDLVSTLMVSTPFLFELLFL